MTPCRLVFEDHLKVDQFNLFYNNEVTLREAGTDPYENVICTPFTNGLHTIQDIQLNINSHAQGKVKSLLDNGLCWLGFAKDTTVTIDPELRRLTELLNLMIKSLLSKVSTMLFTRLTSICNYGSSARSLILNGRKSKILAMLSFQRSNVYGSMLLWNFDGPLSTFL